MKTRILIAAFLISLALLVPPPSVSGNYNVKLEGDSFRVTWTINAIQNLTSFPISETVYPSNLNTSLTGADLSQFSSALQTAVQEKNKAITVSDESIHLSSNSSNSSCVSCLQWLNTTATFQVHNPAVQTHFGVAQYDMSWMALFLNEDLSAGGISYNRLGQDYLLAAVVPFILFVPTTDRSLLMKVNGAAITKLGYQPLISNLVLFDVSAMRSSLGAWSHSQDLNSQSQTWTSPQSGGFNFTATETVKSENVKLVYVAGVRVLAQFSAPLNAIVRSNTLYVDFSGGLLDKIGLVAIVASIGVLAGTVILERRITGSYRQKPRSRRD